MPAHEGTQAPLSAEAGLALAGLATPEGGVDPYPFYARLRAAAPVHPDGTRVYLTRHQDCVAVIRDPVFHSQNADWMDRARPGWREHPGLRVTTESFLFQDSPGHTRLRRLVAGAFTQRRAVALREEIERLTARTLDAVADAGADGGAVDLHDILAARLPIAVIGHVLGVPAADHAMLREPLEGLRLAVDGRSTAENLLLIDRAAEALLDYFAGLVAERRRSPREDVISGLAHELGELAEDEILQTAMLIFSAAIESMVDMLLNGLTALTAHQEQLALLRARPELTPGAVEEMLRYDAPVQAMARIAGQDTEIDGVPVAADSVVLLMLGAANRDPAVFAEPDVFDITRTGTAPLSFGGGAHHCLGAPLARMEAAVFFPALLSRFPALRPAVGDQAPTRRGFVLRGFATYPVTLR